MGERRQLWTAVGAVALVVVGFAAGAAGSAWSARNHRAARWRKMQVEHEGGEGVTTRTRVLFASAKLPIQIVEVIGNPEGKPERAHVQLPTGVELAVGYRDARPASLEGPDGGQARFTYKGSKAWVGFYTADGSRTAEAVVRVPMELRSSLRLAHADPDEGADLSAFAYLWNTLTEWSPIGQAWAQPQQEAKEDEPITVEREVHLHLDIRAPSGKGVTPGEAQIEATCLPFICLPLTPEVSMPGLSTVRIGVSGSAKRSTLKAPASSKTLASFKERAREERGYAERMLPHVAGVVAAVGVTALACKARALAWPICVPGVGKKARVLGGAITSVSSHRVKTTGPLISERAEALYYQDQVRASLDRTATIQVCVSRPGYTRACTKLAGRPFAAKPMPEEQRSVELRRGLGGTLAGSFDLRQSDGADCKFSPSPKTSGKLSLSVDEKTGVMTVKLHAKERGTRPNLGCSLGTGTMTWTQTYSVTATQTFSKQQLQAGGKLPLRLTGSMQGAGGYSWSNCSSSSGASVGCPAGRREPYNYPTQILGDLNLDTQTGNGRIVVSGSPLSTQGSWRIPAGGTK